MYDKLLQAVIRGFRIDQKLGIYENKEQEKYVVLQEHVSFLTRMYLWLFFVIFAAFTFGLPYWSIIFNDVLGLWRFCNTPADHIKCGLNRSFSDIALAYNNTWASRWRTDPLRGGTFFGCGCGEGVVSDWMCSIVSETAAMKMSENFHRPTLESKTGMGGFTLSYYIATSPGTGAMAAVTSVPIFCMWWYGGGIELFMDRYLTYKETSGLFKFTYWTLIAFTGNFFVFLGASGCMFVKVHCFTSASFILFGALHFLGVAGISMRKQGKAVTLHSKLIVADLVVALIGFGSGATSKMWPGLNGYGFFFGECWGLSCLFLLVPMLATFATDDVDREGKEYIIDSEPTLLYWTFKGAKWCHGSRVSRVIDQGYPIDLTSGPCRHIKKWPLRHDMTDDEIAQKLYQLGYLQKPERGIPFSRVSNWLVEPIEVEMADAPSLMLGRP